MQFIQIIQTTIEQTILKVFVSLVLTFFFFFGNLNTEGVIAVLMLICFDTVLGMMATYSEGNAFTSRKFSRIVQKSTVYFMAISAGYFTDNAIGFALVQATMIGFIAITEMMSVLENMARMGYETPKKLLNQLKDFKSQK
jgi:phage-related holin